MFYKLTSRDNIESDILEVWPAVLNNTFDKFHNKVILQWFHSEDDIMHWLECKSNLKSQTRQTISKTFKNGDPNKLYSVYRCIHDKPDHGIEIKDTYMYSLRFKKAFEAHMTFRTEKGTRNNSSFKKINIHPYIDEYVDYSSSVREIRTEFFEGIYPIDIDDKDELSTEYMEFVAHIHDADTEENKDKEYTIIVSDSSHLSSWLEVLLGKLSMVEKYLQYFAKYKMNSNIRNTISLIDDNDHNIMIQYITKIMDDNKQNTMEDSFTQSKIKNLVLDPILYNGNLYQIRYGDTLLTWHSKYGYILNKYQIIPSKQFADIIINFDLSIFYKQYQTRDNLVQIIFNLEILYGINKDPKKSALREGKLEFGFDHAKFIQSTNKYHKIKKKFNKY